MAVRITCGNCYRSWPLEGPSTCVCRGAVPAPLVIIAVLALAVALLSGCQTISTMNRMGRVVPQVEDLVYLQDQENRHPTPNGVKAEVCAADQVEREELVAVANLMGWLSFPTVAVDGRPNCVEVRYQKAKP